MKKYIIILLTLVTFNMASAQVSLRVVAFENYKYLNISSGNGPRSAFNIGLGLMAQPHENIALSIDFKKDVMATLADQPMHIEYTDGSITYSSNSTMSVQEFFYKSSFLFKGRENNSMYIGSGIGYRKFEFTSNISGYYEYTGSDEVPEFKVVTITSTKTVVPIGFYLGLMMENDGVFSDYYIGYTTNIGSQNSWSSDFSTYGIKAPLMPGSLVFGWVWNFCPKNI